MNYVIAEHTSVAESQIPIKNDVFRDAMGMHIVALYKFTLSL